MTLYCDWCGNALTRTKWEAERRDHHFCSRECFAEWLSLHRSGPGNPNWQGGDVELTCAHCGTRLTRCRARTRLYDHHFCSKECQYEWQLRNQVTVQCQQCGRPIAKRESLAQRQDRHFCSRECQATWFSGPNAPNWRGGVSFEPYSPEFNKALKKRLRERDEHTCALCGEPGRCVHHIDGNKANNSDLNLMALWDFAG